MAFDIITLGHGEMLTGVFQAIAACVNSHTGSLYTPLIRISLLMGVMWSALMLLQADFTRAIQQWLLPAMLIFNLGFVPNTSVWIIDPVSHTQQKVDHVPYGLALFAGTINRLGFNLTKAIEIVFSLPDDLKYHKTGLLFGSHLVQQSRTFQLANEDFVENLKRFVGECVTHDILLGKYTLNELRHHPNLWHLIASQASPLRAFLWQPPKSPGESLRSPSELITCKRGVMRFNSLWDSEMKTSMSQFNQRLTSCSRHNPMEKQILTALPIAYSALTQLSQSASDLLKQQAMISVITDGMEEKSTSLGNSPNFAVQQAYLQQRKLQETQGALATQILHSMRGILEALTYVAFIFLIPLALLPMGYNFFKNWIGLLIWLQMWGPLYAVLNYIMTLTAANRSWAALSVSNHQGITLANAMGLAQANADVSAMASYLVMSIPFLCIALVRGVNSVAHMAATMSAPAQSATHSAVSEAIRGNYTFGNLSGDGVQIQQVGGWQQSYASQYQNASHTLNNGHTSLTRTPGGVSIAQSTDSRFPMSLNVAKSLQSQFEKQASQLQSQGDAFTETAMISRANSLTKNTALSERLAHSQQSMDQNTRQASVEATQAISDMRRIQKQFAEENNVTMDQSATFLASANIGGEKGFAILDGKVGGELMNNRASLQEVYKSAQDLVNSQDYQRTQQLAAQQTHLLSQHSTDETIRDLATSAAQSWTDSQTASETAEHSYRTAQDYQERAAYTENQATTINQDHSQCFFEYLEDKLGTEQAVQKFRDPSALEQYGQQYLTQANLLPKNNEYIKPLDKIQEKMIAKKQDLAHTISQADAIGESNIKALHAEGQSASITGNKGLFLTPEFNSMQHDTQKAFYDRQSSLEQDYNHAHQQHNQKSEESLLKKTVIDGSVSYIKHEGKALGRGLRKGVLKAGEIFGTFEQPMIQPSIHEGMFKQEELIKPSEFTGQEKNEG
jgi:conjugal transfer mating pair stabilization protein TraG